MSSELRQAITFVPADDIKQTIQKSDDPCTLTDKAAEDLGPEHADTLTTMHALAMLQTELGQYKLAKQTYRQLLAIDERRDGPDTLWAIGTIWRRC